MSHTRTVGSGKVSWRRWALAAAASASAALFGGCANNKTGEADMLTQENQALRERAAQLEASLGAAEARRVSLEEENQNLARQLNDARSEASRLASQPVAPLGRDTGFEGISDVGVSRGRGEIKLEIAGDVLFDSGSVTLKTAARRSLDQIADVIKNRYSTNTIRVEGYTDSDPIRKSKWQTNERLSAERAMAVETYLVSKGVNNNRIYAAAFGPANPKSSKKDSRRVEIVVIE